MFSIWRGYLISVLASFYRLKNNTRLFSVKLFLFFISINIVFYWLAMLTAFPELTFGAKQNEYFLLQFPVGFMGGLFDSASLIITLYIVKRALHSPSNFTYLLHLSVDIFIAVCATLWVLFVFSFSGWLIGFITQQPESLIDRSLIYEERFVSALQNPSGKNELKNIYFGLVMGCSAMIPTMVHLSLFAKSAHRYIRFGSKLDE